MEKNFENECKVLLNSDDYEYIYNYFNLNKCQPIKQVNYYFDTINFNLAHNKYNLRVRHVLNKDTFTLTIKIPQTNGSNLEINEDITYEQFKDLIELHKVPNGFIDDQIKKINKEEIILLASLVTTRYEFEYNCGILALDFNEYNDKCDYEIEFEGKDMEHAHYSINKLMNELDIDFTFSKISKRKRAIESRI